LTNISTLTYCSSATAPTMAWRNPPKLPMAALCTACTFAGRIFITTQRDSTEQYPGTDIGPNGYIFP